MEDGGCGLLVADDAKAICDVFKRCAEGDWLNSVTSENCVDAVLGITWEKRAESHLYPIYARLLGRSNA